MLQGYLMLVILAGGLLSIPLTLWLIRRYRKRVIRLMGKSRGRAPVEPAVVTTRAVSFQFNVIQPGRPLGDTAAFAMRQHRRVVASYVMGLLVFAIGAAICLIRSGGTALSIERVSTFGLIYLTPLLLVLPLLVGLSRRKWLMGFVLLLAVYLTLGVSLSYNTTNSDILGLLVLFGGQVVVPTVLVAVLLHPRLRAGGVLVLVLTTLGVAGAYGSAVLFQEDKSLGLVTDFFFDQGVRNANDMFLTMNLLGLLLGGIVAWWLLRLIKRRYLSKAASDRSLLVDGIVLYFTIWLGLLASAQDLKWLLVALACFVAYKLVVTLLLRHWVYAASQQHLPKSLLLLRVFALQGRSDALFRRLSRYWRLQGPVHLIAGPDIVQSTIEPHEFMDFLSGQLSRQFLPDEQSVAQRVQTLDTLPNKDGYYSVNDLFCHDNTWRLALAQLAQHSDQVLMDLRSFSEHRKGCIHEINALFRLVPVEQFRFIIDPTTDTPFLKAVIADACRQIPVGSPNDRTGGTLQIQAHWLEGERYNVKALLGI